MLSAGCRYGIQAALHLARQRNGGYQPVRTISEALGIPHHFLAKVLQDMAGKGILKSHRGRGGGVALAQSPEKITLRDIVNAFGEVPPLQACPLGLRECRPPSCLIDRRCENARSALQDIFERTTLAEAAQQIDDDGDGGRSAR